MAKTALVLTPEERKAYQPADALERRAAQGDALLRERYDNARQLAQQISGLLRTQFGAQRVVVFGSLTNPEWFTPWSDIDWRHLA